MGNVMSYNSEHLNQTAGKLNQASTKAGSAQTTASSKFTGMNSLFGSGVGEISKQLGQLSGSLSNVQGILSKHNEAIFNMDGALAKAADVIEVPQDFVKNDANRFTEFHEMLIEKLDGRTVNDGHETDVKENLADSGVNLAHIYDQTTTKGADLQTYDESSAIAAQKSMANVNVQGGDNLQKYDDVSNIAASALASIAKTTGAEEQKYNDASIVSEGQLANINNAGGMSEQSINENTVVNAKVLNNVNNRIDLTEQSYDEASKIATETVIKDMSEPDGVHEETLQDAASIVKDMGFNEAFVNSSNNQESGK